ncbi:DUF6491 family protein [Sphingorhabdus contaminans]|uniref:DUF6491 family protein n=1 Tax=Sphingorhabdus contaminans TaxID=1343899 RepID=UPI003D26F149
MRYLVLSMMFMASASSVTAQEPEAPTHDWPELGVEAAVDIRPAQPLYNFTADGDEGVWLQDFRKRWYYATILGPCPGLGRAFGIGYDLRGSIGFDKSAKLIVDGFQCGLSSLVTSDVPPSKREIKARIKARAAEKRARAAEARAAKRAEN